jgi:hypothetical protein
MASDYTVLYLSFKSLYSKRVLFIKYASLKCHLQSAGGRAGDFLRSDMLLSQAEEQKGAEILRVFFSFCKLVGRFAIQIRLREKVNLSS